ncbi:MAG: carbohydrate porin [Deltaproteobacteria bacterium]|nr:carbohydrate porin [Deltaproteobacteria bacterium]
MSLLRTSALALLGVLALEVSALAQDDVDDTAADTEPSIAPEPSPEASPDPDKMDVEEPPPSEVTPGATPETPPDATVTASATADADKPPETGFAFGSYGRVSMGSDLRGGAPERISVVAHPPRIVEPSYVETDLYYRWLTRKGVKLRTVTTLAFDDTLFHYTGEFDAQPALRNLFLEARLPSGLTLWAGSRMYRGDDIYLLDYWPLDDVNTLGAGASFEKKRWNAAVHVGTNRLLDPFQYQTDDVAAPDTGATTIEVLDRQRVIATAMATAFFDVAGLHTKAKLYAELQELASGQRQRADDTIEELAADHGVSLGAQLGAWGFGGGASHANLFVRYAKGLSAFDELAAPRGLDQKFSSWPGASEFVVGTGAALEHRLFNVAGAAYARRFVDADASTRDRDDGWEYAADVRPQVAVAGDVMAGIDLSYQARFPRGVSPTTLLAADPAVFQIAPMVVYAPMGRGAHDRPQLRLVWRAAHLNDAALDLYAVSDPRRAHAWVHFLGVQAEWWFNSSTR